jgi:hypothetical protein
MRRGSGSDGWSLRIARVGRRARAGESGPYGWLRAGHLRLAGRAIGLRHRRSKDAGRWEQGTMASGARGRADEDVRPYGIFCIFVVDSPPSSL